MFVAVSLLSVVGVSLLIPSLPRDERQVLWDRPNAPEPRQMRRSPAPTPTPYVLPQVVAVPDHGPPGTLVEVGGEGFSDEWWQHLNGFDEPGGSMEYFGITRDDGSCDLIVHDTYVSSHVTPEGHLTAAFKVGRTGSCFQEGRTVDVTPGEYRIHLLCHACAVGSFRVTE